MKSYDPKKLSKYILYLDMNNLYGWQMNSYLPYGGFEWLKNVYVSSRESPIAYILEVDLEYHDELHLLHK